MLELIKRKAKSQIADNLKELGMTAVDLMLIHFPECEGGSVADTWAALEEAYQAGQSKAMYAALGLDPSTRRSAFCPAQSATHALAPHTGTAASPTSCSPTSRS